MIQNASNKNEWRVRLWVQNLWVFLKLTNNNNNNFQHLLWLKSVNKQYKIIRKLVFRLLA